MVLDSYRISACLPKSEPYGLADQIKRAAVSVPTITVEGHSRNSHKDFIRFLYIARGSLEELRYLLLLSRDLAYLTEDSHYELEEGCEQVSKLLNALIRSLANSHE